MFSLGALAIGFAAINTGNNLLFLLLGAMLGFIAVSSWLSEQVIGKISIQRAVPRGVTVGNPFRIHYTVSNGRRWIPAFALEVGEEGLPGLAFIPSLKAGEGTQALAENRFVRRGVYPLGSVSISTSFPFGLFRKTRTLTIPGEIVVWPRTDRRTRRVTPRGRGSASGEIAVPGPSGPRGEYRGLRGYRPGDDPKDIHWRTTARLGTPVVKEYEQDVGEDFWICLDTRGAEGEGAEAAVETAAALAARALREGKRFGFSAPGTMIDGGQAPLQLQRVLDVLARVEFMPTSPAPVPPLSPRRCVLVTLNPGAGSSFGHVFLLSPDPESGDGPGTWGGSWIPGPLGILDADGSLDTSGPPGRPPREEGDR